MDGLQPLYSGRTVPDTIPFPAPLRLLKREIDTPVSREGLPVTEAEYRKVWYDAPDVTYEWCNGILEERPVSDLEGWLIGQWLVALMNAFFQVQPIAHTVGPDIGFRMNLSGRVRIRRPDFAVVLNRNPVGMHLKDAFYNGMYDLCVEVLSHTSPSGVMRDTVYKKQEYAGAGVQEYYILDSNRKETMFYRLAGNRTYQPIQPINGDIIQSCVLPGFQFRTRDLYKCPSLETLMRDPVYQHYVLLGYQQAEQRAEQTEALLVLEKQRAEQADLRAEQEKQRAEQTESLLMLEKLRAEQADLRAEQEKQRAEQADLRAAKLAARLKELGISPDDLA